MTPEQKPSRRGRSPKPDPAPPSCGTCDGTGETTTTVRVGRKRREIGATQAGLCPGCLGTGTA
ncbi:hypothetical protein [Streptomyces sp. NBC_01565]|uniref:hypothetical protein n=1 Tax=Streptomyces sp. NBC_01565 TaxID=2975881 RepID=UPI00224FB9F5|nr:hypothetical protein [Streptomyces sp. NBC_01565]MCX4542361.1 hypothetical protein [Streptomyces sp. NBC_01565]